MRRACRAAVVLFLLACGAPGFGQQAPTAASPSRAIALFVEPAAGAGIDADLLVLLSRAMLVALQAASPVQSAGIVLRDAPASTDDAQRDGTAISRGASGWLRATVSVTAQGIRLHWEGKDLTSGEAVAARDVTIPGSLDTLTLPDLDWSAAAAVVVKDFPAGTAESVVTAAPLARQGSATLTVHAQPRSTVAVKGGASIVIGTDGSGTLTLPIPGTYALRVSGPGLAPVSRDVFLSFDRDVTFTQARLPRWGVDLSLLSFAFPALRLSWSPVPDVLSVRLGATTYSAGLAFTSEQVFSSAPLTNIEAGVDWFILPSDAVLRPYVGLGGFARLVHAAQYTGIEPLSPAAVTLTLGTEIGGSAAGAAFLEWEPTVFITTSVPLFLASLGAGAPPTGWFALSPVVVQLPAFRIGYRWRP